MKNTKPLVAIFMGSESDFPVMEEAARVLSDFQVPWDMRVTSAHRSPERTLALAKKAAGRGIEVIIAGAGGAAHLAGVIAAHTILPVIGVPLESSLKGFDSLLSTAQMPAGVPVATMGIGKAGAQNAGILAVQILSGKHPGLKRSLLRHKAALAAKVEKQTETSAENFSSPGPRKHRENRRGGLTKKGAKE